MRIVLSISLSLLLLFSNSSVFATKIVMIGSAVPFAGADLTAKEFLEALGFEVEEHSQDEDDPVDITGAAAVFIGEALGSGNVADGYKDVPIPVVITESYVLDDMRLATDGTFNAAQDTKLVIVDPDHPIAGGLTGEVEIGTAPVDICSTSDIQGDAQVIANVLSTGDTALACYEEGAADMDGVPVPARRVFLFLFAELVPIATDEAWGLVERSVFWAVGMLEEAAVDPGESMAVTWGDLKAN